MTILVGADPEVFVTREGELVSGHGLVPGTKKEPFKVKGGAVQVDGMALEFNIDPADNQKQFTYRIHQVMRQLKKLVPEYDLLAEPVAEFGREMIDAQPQEAKELGCDPDFNAYTGEENPVPDVDAPFRTGSGHIHVGLWDPNGPMPVNHKEVVERYVQNMDAFLAAPFMFVDKDQRRRELYGKAGAYRLKPYGFEYRTLSNKWLTSTRYINWVYQNTLMAVHGVAQGNEPSRWDYEELDNAIDTGDLGYCARMIRDWDIPVPYGVGKEVKAHVG